MKKLLLIAFIFSLSNVYAQDTILMEKGVICTGEVLIDGGNISIRHNDVLEIFPISQVTYISDYDSLTNRTTYFKDGSWGCFPTNEYGHAEYSQVIQMDNLSQKHIYFRAKDWFINSFNSPKNVIQMDDKEDGIIVGKAQTSTVTYKDVITSQAGYFTYLVTIKVKDGRYKYSISEITYKSEASFTGGNDGADLADEKGGNKGNVPKWKRERWSQIREQAFLQMVNIELSIQMSMLKEIEDDW